MHLLLFFYLDNQIFDIAKINKIIFAKFTTKKDGSTRELFGIISLIMLYNSYENQNLNIPFIKQFDHSLSEYIK